MAFEVERLSDKLDFGKRVRGITRTDLDKQAVRDSIREMFIDDGIVLFHAVDMNAEFHVELSKAAGKLSIHPMTKQLAVDGYEELIALKYDPAKEAVYEVDGELLGSYVAWHFDGVFTPKLNRGGVLRNTVKAYKGGLTAFVDKANAYDTLPQELKDRIEGLEVVYQLGFEYPFVTRNDVRVVRDGDTLRRSRARIANGDFPPVVHPLVCIHPESGRKLLNFSTNYAEGVVGMKLADSVPILRAVADHVTDESRAYFHDWGSPDELVLWDNWRMNHKACGVPQDATREVQRTTIDGDYALGRAATTEDLASTELYHAAPRP